MKFNKIKIIICMFTAIFLLYLVIDNYDSIRERFLGKEETEEKKEESDSLKFKKEYEEYNDKENASGKTYPKVEVEDDNPIKYSNADEIVKLVNNGTGIIYLGYPTCPWCRNAVPILLQAAKDTGIDKIYYMNMHDERDSYIVKDDELVLTKEGTEGYKKLLKVFDGILDDYVVDGYNTKEKRIYVPSVIFVRDGEIVGYHMDTVKSQEDPYVVLNEKQQEELYNIYTSNIHEMLQDLCDERC